MISMRVLLIEDQELMRALIVRLLDGMTSRIVETGTLSGALEACSKEEFDVVMFDLVLEDASAEMSLAALPEIKRRSKAPVVVVSGWPDPELKAKSLRAGADTFLPKDEAFANKSRAFLMALHAAVLKQPRASHGDSFMEHVGLLERLVRAVA